MIKWTSVTVPKVTAVNTAGVWTAVRSQQTVRVIATEGGSEVEKTRAEFEMRATTAESAIAARNSSGINTGLITTNIANVTNVMNFMKKAWEMSRIQKVLNALTLITVLHNATMISRDVGETLGYALSQGLDVLGINDEEGNPLDINGWFGDQVNNFFEGIFGAERWHGLNETWNKANRVIQSATNIVWTLRSINDGTQEVMEWIGENTGKIGNALKRSGVIQERSYPWMAERVRAQDAYRRKMGKILDGLESAENVASSYAEVTSNVNEIADEISELGEQRQRFNDSVRDFAPGADPDNSDIPQTYTEAASNAISGAEPTPQDMEPSTDTLP